MRRKIISWAIMGLAVLLLAGGAFVGGLSYQRQEKVPEPLPEPEPVITADTIANEVKGISELATLEYRYTNVGKFEETVDFYGWQVPFTTKSFIISYDGAMKLGIDSEDIQIKLVGNEVQVQLPEAKVLSHEIYEDTLEVLDQTKNIFNQIEIDDYATFAADRKKEMEEKARSGGMYEDAKERARVQLESFLVSLPSIREDYTVKFVEPEIEEE